MRSMTKGRPHTKIKTTIGSETANSGTTNNKNATCNPLTNSTAGNEQACWQSAQQTRSNPRTIRQTITTIGGSNMTNTYNDVPEVERETADGIRTVSLLTDALTGRKVFLFGNIDENLVFSFTMQMLKLMEDEQSEINIYINSPGGEVNAGLAIYDLIQSCRAPINMYCVGMAASMGAVIFAGGQKGRRFILPHSKVMIHEPLIPLGVGGSVSSVKNTADLMMQTRQELNEILAKHTEKSIEEINRATEYNNYMDAKEAVAFGICDWVTDDLM